MNVFEPRDRLVADYGSYTRSFIKIAGSKKPTQLFGGVRNDSQGWGRGLLEHRRGFARPDRHNPADRTHKPS